MIEDDRKISSIKEKIWEKIENTSDDNMKTILMLMFGSLEYTDSAIRRIESKIDSLRHDETALRKAVLNGYDGKHHIHHDWLEQRILNDKNIKEFIERAKPVLDWAEAHQARQKELEPVCKWAEESMEAAQDARKDKKYLFMKFLGNFIGYFGTSLATLTAAYFMWGPK